MTVKSVIFADSIDPVINAGEEANHNANSLNEHRYRSVDESQGHQHGSLSGPALSIISSNIDGLRLAELCIRNICDILCLQETQRGPSRNRPRIPGMTLITERLHDQYGRAIFVRNGQTVDNPFVSENDNIDVILFIEVIRISVSSVYKPPIETFRHV